MAQSTEESLLDKLLKSRYPLTHYLSRQQQFVRTYSTPQAAVAPSPPPAESTTVVSRKRKAPLPPPSCFNVPDTLDFNATEYEQNDDEMDQSSGLEDDAIQECDETLLLKEINNQIKDRNSDLIKRSSAIHLEFSPYEHNSPLQKAIQNGLNIINK